MFVFVQVCAHAAIIGKSQYRFKHRICIHKKCLKIVFESVDGTLRTQIIVIILQEILDYIYFNVLANESELLYFSFNTYIKN